MTLRIASQGYQIHKLPVLVTRYRRHPDNLSRRYKVLLDADLRTIAPYQSHPPTSAAARSWSTRP